MKDHSKSTSAAGSCLNSPRKETQKTAISAAAILCAQASSRADLRVILLPQFAESVQRVIEIRDRVAGVHADAQPGGPQGNRREHYRRNEDAVVAQGARKTQRRFLVLQDYGNDRGLRESGIVTQVLQTGAQIIGAVAKTRDQMRLGIQYRQPLPDRARGCRAKRGREDVRGRRMLQEYRDLFRHGDKPTRRR